MPSKWKNTAKPLISHNEEPYISKEAKNENALASEGKSSWPEKINMRVTTSQYEIYLLSGQNSYLLSESKVPPKHNLPDKENNSLEQATGGHFVCTCVNMACWSATEAFSMNCLRSVPAFAGCFLELNDVYWVLHSKNVFFKVSWYFYDESDFIVASLLPLRGQSFLS